MVPGTVLALNVDDTQTVKAGQSLLSLDPADARIAEADAEADLARARAPGARPVCQGQELRAQIEQREQAERTADEDLKRRSGLLADGAISSEELSACARRRDHDACQRRGGPPAIESNRRADRRHHHRGSSSGAGGGSGGSQCRTGVASHGTGLAGHRCDREALRAGGRARAAGTPLLAVVPLDDGVGRRQLQGRTTRAHARGQPVTVRTDLYGRQVTYHGHLVGIAAGSGSAFALLPAQNASGNWIKIVQRVPSAHSPGSQ